MALYEDGSYSCLPGITLLSKILASKGKLEYTKATAGSGTIPEDRTPQTMTESAGFEMNAQIAEVGSPVDGECQITIQINSDSVSKGFYCTNILLFAKGLNGEDVPYTYLVLENSPEWIRPSSSKVGKFATFEIIAAVGETKSVSAIIDKDSMLTKKTGEELISSSLKTSLNAHKTEAIPHTYEDKKGSALIDLEFRLIQLLKKETNGDQIVTTIFNDDVSAQRQDSNKRPRPGKEGYRLNLDDSGTSILKVDEISSNSINSKSVNTELLEAGMYLLKNNPFKKDFITLESGVTDSVDSSWVSMPPLGARCTGSEVQIRGVVQFKFNGTGAQDLVKLKLNKTTPTDAKTADAFMPPPIGTVTKIVKAAIIKSAGSSNYALACIGITTGTTYSVIRVYWVVDLAGNSPTRVNTADKTVALQLDMEYPVDLNDYK